MAWQITCPHCGTIENVPWRTFRYQCKHCSRQVAWRDAQPTEIVPAANPITLSTGTKIIGHTPDGAPIYETDPTKLKKGGQEN